MAQINQNTHADADPFGFAEAPYPIRADISAAYLEFWRALAQPGNWWTGDQRIAIAQEVRRARQCGLCTDRKRALSPYNFPQAHQHTVELSDLAVDAIHRIVTDQDRITQAYINANAEAGLSKEHYVEMAGIVVCLFSIDEFHRALGLPLAPLPIAVAGEPSHYRPDNTDETTGFVPMIRADKPAANEADLWSPGRTANVLRALSLVPDAVRNWTSIASAQYLSIKDMANFVQLEGRAINRMQMELIAGRVSAINECFY